ncbi:MAG: sugar phosphate isomerase/epimerase [Planctomycetes bacterium]|nr:sugar phosphate isomerase/epimerase [Planctomycetota bacterium]
MRRRDFVKAVGLGAAASQVLGCQAGPRRDDAPAAKEEGTMKIGFHTDAFNTSYRSFEACLQWAKANGVHSIECGLIDGVSWIHGLGYQPHVALYEDPVLLGRKMAGYGVRFSQVDAAFPLSGKEGPVRGVPYVMNAIRWAKLIGCPCVDTTDGMHKPEGLDDEAAMALMKFCYEEILKVAEAHQIVVNIEPHGYFTTRPDMMERMLGFSDSRYLRMNMDTGNTFIAGQDPVAFLERFIDRVSHVHVKDVSESLAAATRGQQTGIAVSQCALGDGANAGNIRRCLELLRDHGYRGVLSMECEGQGGPMIERSLAWVRKTLAELKIPIDD